MSVEKIILIIDDEPDLVMLLTGAVSSLGYKIATASNGLEGLELLKTLRPELIILDMNMPKMGGVAFYNELASRTRTGRPEFSVLVLTARANLETFFKDMDVDGFMTKPFEIADLLREVTAIIRARTAGPAARSPKRTPGAVPSVLLIEDRDEPAEKIGAILRAKGYKVHRAGSGASGIEQAKLSQPDLVLANLSLRDVPGETVAQRLKTMPLTQDLKVLLYAPKFIGSDRTILDQICKKAGIDHALESDDPETLLYGCERALKELAESSET
jgi:CheY-like chemotaxis protein